MLNFNKIMNSLSLHLRKEVQRGNDSEYFFAAPYVHGVVNNLFSDSPRVI